MNTFEKTKAKFDLEKTYYEAFEGFDLNLQKDVLVISYWETAHTMIEMVFDINGNYLHTEKTNDWDYI